MVNNQDRERILCDSRQGAIGGGVLRFAQDDKGKREGLLDTAPHGCEEHFGLKPRLSLRSDAGLKGRSSTKNISRAFSGNCLGCRCHK